MYLTPTIFTVYSKFFFFSLDMNLAFTQQITAACFTKIKLKCNQNMNILWFVEEKTKWPDVQTWMTHTRIWCLCRTLPEVKTDSMTEERKEEKNMEKNEPMIISSLKRLPFTAFSKQFFFKHLNTYTVKCIQIWLANQRSPLTKTNKQLQRDDFWTLCYETWRAGIDR